MLASIIIQIALFGKYLTNDVISALHPSFGDAKEYNDTVLEYIRTGSFTDTFKSGWRLPGYPYFIFVCYKIAAVVNIQPLVFVRLVQLLLLSTIPVFAYKATFNFTASIKKSGTAAVIFVGYIPFYYFFPMIGGESAGLFLMGLFFLAVSKLFILKNYYRQLAIIAVIIAVSTYFKPNHILIAFPVFCILLYKFIIEKKEYINWLKHSFYFGFIIIILIMPWSIFVSNQNKMLIPLATTSGPDMVIGTGIQINGMDKEGNSLTFKFEKKHNLAADSVFLHQKDSLSIAQKNALYQKEAIAIWKKRPLITIEYGFVKILHAFGFGFRGVKDYFSLCIFLLGMGSLLSKKFRKQNRNIIIISLSLLAVFCLQTFVYFGDMRLRILMMDFSFLMLIAICIANFTDEKK
ncbi:MAG: hypothetical protein WDM90_08290 [Ferruginibacter sp.]